MLLYVGEPIMHSALKSCPAVWTLLPSNLNRAQGCFLSGGTCFTGQTESSLHTIANRDTGNCTVWFWPGVSCLWLGMDHERGRHFSRSGQHRENSENKTDKHKELQWKRDLVRSQSALMGWSCLRKYNIFGFQSVKNKNSLFKCLPAYFSPSHQAEFNQ